LIYNPSFSLGANGKSGWRNGGSISSTVTLGVLQLNFPSVVDGWFTQFVTNPQYALRAGLTMNAWVTVSNPDSVSKPMQLMMRDAYFSNAYLCTFMVPANSSDMIYSMKFKTLTDWQMIRADLRVATADANGLYFDDVNLRYLPDLVIASNKECIVPVPDETPPPPPETNLVKA
jgi:hypothetical protein